MPRVSPDGWTVAITHPQSGRTIQPDVLSDPQYIPSLNSLPEVRIPIRRAPSWLRQEFDDNPSMDVWLDGQQLPIDELQRVEDDQGQTVLVGIGGVELRNRVALERNEVLAESAAKDLIQNETSYQADVDDTDRAGDEDVVFQSASTTSEFNDIIADVPATEPIIATGDTLTLAQTGFVTEVDQPNTISRSDFSDGEGGQFGSAGVTVGSFNATVEYDLPIDNITAYFRGETTNGDAFLDPVINGTKYNGTTVPDSLGWDSVDLSGSGSVSGSTDFSFETDVLNSGSAEIDVVAFVDDRFSYTIDNQVHTSGGYLDGPELYPDAAPVIIPAGESTFNIVAAKLQTTIDDVSGSQALEVSHDDGKTFLPSDGSEQNTESVSVEFAGVGTDLETRITLQRLSPNGARSQTPRYGYDSQAISEWDLTADLQFDSILLDFQRDDDLETVLNDIAGDKFVWSYRIESGTPTIAWTEPGSRIADSDPDIEDINVEKQVETFGKVTVKGSDNEVSGEQITADIGNAVSLAETNIRPGSEAVRDSSGTNYDRRDDYSMDYQAGEITVLGDGTISDGTSLTIDYRHQISATFTSDDAATPPREIVEDIPGIVSTRQAKIIASVIADVDPGLATPSFDGDIVVPRLSAGFDPLEALPLDDFDDIPDIATPLPPRGSIELTPQGIVFRVGSQTRISQSLSDIKNRVQTISRRS